MHAPPPTAPAPEEAPQTKDQYASSARTVTTEELLGEARELLILHAGKRYRLRITRNDRLILNT